MSSLLLKSVTEKRRHTDTLVCPVTNLYWESAGAMKKEHFFLALLSKWACLWLFLISGFVCAELGAHVSLWEARRPFCMISKGGLCLVPAATCLSMSYVLQHYVRLDHGLRITQPFTGTPWFVGLTTTVSGDPHISE